MDTDNRPLSPHLGIYRWQLTMLLSITHRATGIALSLGSFLLLYWLVALANGPQAYAQAQALIGSWLGLLILLGFSAALFFHLCNGIRHLMWDFGAGLSREEAYKSGVVVVAATLVLTILAWGVGLWLKM
jgi:succinate dehydrogenase / fumarate reductase cytochrome b subunit